MCRKARARIASRLEWRAGADEGTDVDQAGHQWIGGVRRSGRGAHDEVLDPATGKVVAKIDVAD